METENEYNARIRRINSFGRDILRAFGEGAVPNREAASEFVDLSHSAVTTFVRMKYKIRDRDDLDDIFQDVFVRLLKYRKKCIEDPKKRPVWAYLYTWARSAAVDHLRATERRRQKVVPLYTNETREDGEDRPNSFLSDSGAGAASIELNVRMIQSLLAALSAKEQLIFRLIFLYNRPPHEVAGLLTLSESTLLRRISRIRTKLRKRKREGF